MENQGTKAARLIEETIGILKVIKDEVRMFGTDPTSRVTEDEEESRIRCIELLDEQIMKLENWNG